MSDNGNGISVDRYSSREEAENAKTFTTTDGAVWTRTYTPGAETWTKAGELALKSDIPNGLATQEYVDTKLTSYVSKTDIVPSQTNIGAAENAVRAVYASYDGNGNLIEDFYAKKTELEQLSAVVGTANTQLEEIA